MLQLREQAAVTQHRVSVLCAKTQPGTSCTPEITEACVAVDCVALAETRCVLLCSSRNRWSVTAHEHLATKNHTYNWFNGQCCQSCNLRHITSQRYHAYKGEGLAEASCRQHHIQWRKDTNKRTFPLHMLCGVCAYDGICPRARRVTSVRVMVLRKTPRVGSPLISSHVLGLSATS